MKHALLRSVHQVPKCEPWPSIIEDLGFPGPVDVGRALGVDPVHVDHWNQEGSAPKWACLALYWLTSWGRAEVHAQAVRDAQLAMQCLRAVERERNELLMGLSRPIGRPMLSAPGDFDRLPFADMPAAATWVDALGRDVQRPSCTFMGGRSKATPGRPKSRPT